MPKLLDIKKKTQICSEHTLDYLPAVVPLRLPVTLILKFSVCLRIQTPAILAIPHADNNRPFEGTHTGEVGYTHIMDFLLGNSVEHTLFDWVNRGWKEWCAHYVIGRPVELGWLLGFYILATSQVISG